MAKRYVYFISYLVSLKFYSWNDGVYPFNTEIVCEELISSIEQINAIENELKRDHKSYTTPKIISFQLLREENVEEEQEAQ